MWNNDQHTSSSVDLAMDEPLLETHGLDNLHVNWRKPFFPFCANCC